MPVFQLPPEVLRVGHPTPFALRDKVGNLLIPRGTLVVSEEQRQQLIARDLYVDDQEGEALKRLIAGKLDSMVRSNATLGQIAQASPGANELAGPASSRRIEDPIGAWTSLQLRLSPLLHEAPTPEFASRLDRVQATLLELASASPDLALLVLVQATTGDTRDYSVKHALLVGVVCELAARHLPGWDDERRRSLRSAALTMNIAMTALQDLLAIQEMPLSATQREQIDAHPLRGVAMLRDAGIGDALWLDAVAQHHASPPGPLAELKPAQQVARLVQRADIFAARLSPRKLRRALSAAAAAKAAYLDEQQQADEAGSAIIKATGIYPPGSLVRLASGEIAVVLKRGRRANEPAVAAIVNPAGVPISEPALRDTRMKPHEVSGGVAPHDIKVRLNLERLLGLV